MINQPRQHASVLGSEVTSDFTSPCAVRSSQGIDQRVFLGLLSTKRNGQMRWRMRYWVANIAERCLECYANDVTPQMKRRIDGVDIVDVDTLADRFSRSMYVTVTLRGGKQRMFKLPSLVRRNECFAAIVRVMRAAREDMSLESISSCIRHQLARYTKALNIVLDVDVTRVAELDAAEITVYISAIDASVDLLRRVIDVLASANETGESYCSSTVPMIIAKDSRETDSVIENETWVPGNLSVSVEDYPAAIAAIRPRSATVSKKNKDAVNRLAASASDTSVTSFLAGTTPDAAHPRAWTQKLPFASVWLDIVASNKPAETALPGSSASFDTRAQRLTLVAFVDFSSIHATIELPNVETVVALLHHVAPPLDARLTEANDVSNASVEREAARLAALVGVPRFTINVNHDNETGPHGARSVRIVRRNADSMEATISTPGEGDSGEERPTSPQVDPRLLSSVYDILARIPPWREVAKAYEHASAHPTGAETPVVPIISGLSVNSRPMTPTRTHDGAPRLRFIETLSEDPRIPIAIALLARLRLDGSAVTAARIKRGEAHGAGSLEPLRRQAERLALYLRMRHACLEAENVIAQTLSLPLMPTVSWDSFGRVLAALPLRLQDPEDLLYLVEQIGATTASRLAQVRVLSKQDSGVAAFISQRLQGLRLSFIAQAPTAASPGIRTMIVENPSMSATRATSHSQARCTTAHGTLHEVVELRLPDLSETIHHTSLDRAAVIGVDSTDVGEVTLKLCDGNPAAVLRYSIPHLPSWFSGLCAMHTAPLRPPAGTAASSCFATQPDRGIFPISAAAPQQGESPAAIVKSPNVSFSKHSGFTTQPEHGEPSDLVEDQRHGTPPLSFSPTLLPGATVMTTDGADGVIETSIEQVPIEKRLDLGEFAAAERAMGHRFMGRSDTIARLVEAQGGAHPALRVGPELLIAAIDAIEASFPNAAMSKHSLLCIIGHTLRVVRHRFSDECAAMHVDNIERESADVAITLTPEAALRVVSGYCEYQDTQDKASHCVAEHRAACKDFTFTAVCEIVLLTLMPMEVVRALRSRRDVLLAGLENTGKTLLVRAMQGRCHTTTPSIGTSATIVPFDRWVVTMHEVGGRPQQRRNLAHYLRMMPPIHGIVFMLDAGCPGTFAEAREYLHLVLHCRTLRNLPCLVLANNVNVRHAVATVAGVKAVLFSRRMMGGRTRRPLNIEFCEHVIPGPLDKNSTHGLNWLLNTIDAALSSGEQVPLPMLKKDALVNLSSATKVSEWQSFGDDRLKSRKQERRRDKERTNMQV